MPLETRIWQAVNIIAILVPAFVTIYATFYFPSPYIAKQLQSSLPLTVDLTGEFSELGDQLKLSITDNNVRVPNLTELIVGITNTGNVPIIPADFYENLSINVDKPWRILLVKNITTRGAAHAVWQKVNDQKFQVKPDLLNPQEVIFASVYATNTQSHPDEHLVLKPHWSTHILNLKAITERKRIEFEDAWIIVFLYGRNLILTVVGTIFFMFVYINLLYYVGALKTHRWQGVVAIIVVSIISFSSSEAMATYVLPNIFYSLAGGISHWMNLPPILANLGVLLWLSVKAWRVHARPPLSHN